jgi:rod shape-determining protein MreD
LTLPFAALGAIVAALLETTVMPEVAIFGVQANLLLTLAVAATVIMGIEDGLVWAFLGGLLVDMLTPARPIGATTFVLLVSVGLAAAGTRFVGQTRAGALMLVFVLTWVYQLLLLATLALTEGVTAGSFDLQHLFGAAVLNTLLAIPFVALFVVLERRFGPQDRERAAWT